MKFIRTDAHKKKRVGTSWRRPKGLQNKMRLRKKGYNVSVKPGYGTNAKLRGTKDEKTIITVATLAELAAIDPKTQAVLIAKVGRRKKEAIIEEAQKKNITITNLSVSKYKEKTQKLIEEKKKKKEEQKAKEAKKKESAKKEEAKKAKEKAEAEKKEAETTEEEKKKEEKKEKDKVLTSKKEHY